MTNERTQLTIALRALLLHVREKAAASRMLEAKKPDFDLQREFLAGQASAFEWVEKRLVETLDGLDAATTEAT